MPTIMISGAGGGIGAATAKAFLEAGWQVALTGRREATLQETAAGHGKVPAMAEYLALCRPGKKARKKPAAGAGIKAARKKARAKWGNS